MIDNAYKKEFEVRWSDLDVNRHVANTAYIAYLNQTRMGYMSERGAGIKEYADWNIGPVLFSEQYHYFREVLPNQTVTCTLQAAGISDDSRFFEIEHNLFNEQGQHSFKAFIKGAFVDMTTRKLVVPPQLLIDIFQGMPRTENFRVFSKEETRSGVKPMN